MKCFSFDVVVGCGSTAAFYFQLQIASRLDHDSSWWWWWVEESRSLFISSYYLIWTNSFMRRPIIVAAKKEVDLELSGASTWAATYNIYSRVIWWIVLYNDFIGLLSLFAAFAPAFALLVHLSWITAHDSLVGFLFFRLSIDREGEEGNWLAAARISHRIGYIHFGVCCALLFVVNSLYFVIFFILFFSAVFFTWSAAFHRFTFI